MRRLLILTALITAALVIWANAAGNEAITSTITLSPLGITMRLGDEPTRITATAYDEIGNVVPDAKIHWMPPVDDPAEHCVSVIDGVITARLVGKCGVGALTVTHAGRLILHQTPVSVVVSEVEPEPTPTPSVTPVPTPTPLSPCRLPNGKIKRNCISLS